MQEQKKFGIVAGYICLDITPLFTNNTPLSKLSELITPGKLTQTRNANIHTGGAAANTGLALKKLGIPVSVISKIGDDPFGKIIMELLKTHEAETNMIISKDATSYSIVLAPPGLDRMFLHFPGANNSFTSTDLDYTAISHASFFHFGYPSMMKKMYANEGRELISMFKKVKSQGVLTSMDMSLADPKTPAGQVDWRKILPHVLPYVDIFAPSLEEITLMLHPQKYKAWLAQSQGENPTDFFSLTKDIQPMARKLISWGVKIVLIKCGEQGIYYQTADKKCFDDLKCHLTQDWTNWPKQAGFHPAFVANKILSTTGAGDASIAGFLAALIKEEDLKACLEMAAAAGASCVEAYDTLSGIKSYDKLKQKIQNNWKQMKLTIKDGHSFH